MNSDNRKSRRNWLSRLRRKLSQPPRNRSELSQLLLAAKNRGLFDQDALAMIEGVLHVSEMQVRNVMVPRTNMVFVPYEAPFAQALPIITESGHSRFPVIRDNQEIMGTLLAKDLLKYTVSDLQSEVYVKDLIRPPVFIPESKRLNVLLKEFRISRNHMAIVIDEYGAISGLITIEDVLEQIVGNIEDEYDIEEHEPDIKKLGEKEFIVKALTTVNNFNHYFGTSLDDENFDTIGGYVIQKFGHMPKRGEFIDIETFRITIVLASKRRLQLLRVTPLTDETTFS